MTLEKDKAILGSQERTCAECGRKFVMSRMDQWVYKLRIKDHTTWYCRWNCVRAAEKRLEESKVGRNKELKSKRPLKEVLEADLRAGLPLLNIARKHGASVASVHNWIRSYSLAGIQGVKKPKVDTPVVEVQNTPRADEMVQTLPSLAEIEQFHTDEPVQELPPIEMDTLGDPSGMTEEENTPDEVWESKASEEDQIKQDAPAPRETCGEIWEDVQADLATLQRMYIEQADKDFRAQLVQLVLAVTNGRGLVG
jgi:transposase-like protein